MSVTGCDLRSFARSAAWLGAALAAILLARPAAACQTVGTFYVERGAADGYTLFAPMSSTTTYLIDMQGRLVHSWPSAYRPGAVARLVDDGHLIRTARLMNTTFTAGGAGGRIEEIDWDGTLLWGFDYSSTQHLQHHDAVRLPNGNILFVAWEFKTGAEAIAAGRNPALLRDGALWPDTLIEVQPQPPSGGTIVWEWHAWDHVVQDFDPSAPNHAPVDQHPELIDLNFTASGAADWLHVNSVAYDPVEDQVILSSHELSEIWILDHSTTTAEAAGHSGGRSGRGGDLLYRWGNPRTWRAGTVADRKLYAQNDPARIPAGLPGAGHILVFNNGVGRPGGNASSVDEIATPPVDADGNYERAPGQDFEPAAPAWTWQARAPTSFYAQNISGAQRLPNGNTLLCHGPQGTFIEVTESGRMVWRYVNPVAAAGIVVQGNPVPIGPGGWTNTVFRAYRYAADFPGFAGRTLTPGAPIELNPEFRPEPVSRLLARRAGADVVLDWTPVTLDLAGSPLVPAGYRVYRDLVPDDLPDREAAANLRGTPPDETFADAGVAGDGRLYYYVVTAIGPQCMESD